MSYSYSSMTRVLLVQHKGQVETTATSTYSVLMIALEIFANTWGYEMIFRIKKKHEVGFKLWLEKIGLYQK